MALDLFQGSACKAENSSAEGNALGRMPISKRESPEGAKDVF
jgi:hypothetical protein